MSRRQRARLIRLAVYAVGVLLLAGVVFGVDWARVQDAMFKTDLVREQFPEIVTQAAWHTIIFTFFGFTGGLAWGLVLALMRLSTVRPYRWFAVAYIEVLRGIPLLITILIIGFGIPIALGARVPFYNSYGPGSLALAMVAGAYIAETIRSGIEAVPTGQMEAARSLGMPHATAMARIVLPQAFRIIVPPLTNEFVLLLKDTSLISVLGVNDATRELARFGRDGVNNTANATPLIVAGLMYLVITIPMTRVAGRLERRAKASR